MLSTLIHTLPLAAAGSGDGGFEGPTLQDFYPQVVLFAGTPFALNRLMLIRILVFLVIVVVFWLGTRRMKIIPSRGQVVLETLTGFVRQSIVIDTLGERDGRRFMGILMGMFFLILGMNITGVVWPLQLAGTSVIGLPLIMALFAWVLFIYAGVKRNGGRFFKNALILPGVPIVLLPLLALLELLSTFILRPITLTLRLLMNMIGGHMLLVLCFSATSFFFFTLLGNGNLLGLLGIGSFAFGVVFVLLDIFIAALQAYVFTILTAIYIQLALADSH